MIMWIYEDKNWPRFTWSLEQISSLLNEVRYKQGRLIGRMESLGFDAQQEATLDIMTSDIIKSSAIEGETLNKDEVRSSIASRLGIHVKESIRVGRHTDGIVEMMLDATQKYKNPLTKERLFAWHTSLFPTERSGMSYIRVGEWRSPESGPMQVVSGAYGREKVHFEAPSAERIDHEITLFLEWVNTHQDIDPILRAGLAHLWFVTIHPFEDGNGRIGRAIIDMLCARADGTKNRFYSISTQIEQERKDYYNALEQQQRAHVDLTPWLMWFLGCVHRAINNTDKTIGRVLYKSKVWDYVTPYPINDRQRKIINRMLENDFEGFMNTSKYARMANCSTDTALRDIQSLQKYGVFIQNPGSGRSTSYRIISKEDV